jgi:hypothetical protein
MLLILSCIQMRNPPSELKSRSEMECRVKSLWNRTGRALSSTSTMAMSKASVAIICSRLAFLFHEWLVVGDIVCIHDEINGLQPRRCSCTPRSMRHSDRTAV